MKLEFSRQLLEKYTHIKFCDNLSNGSRVVPCGRTDGQTDMTKLIGTSRNFANVPQNYVIPSFRDTVLVLHKGNASDAQGLVRACLFVLCVIYEYLTTLSTSTALLQRQW